jgi:hypothetical protein
VHSLVPAAPHFLDVQPSESKEELVRGLGRVVQHLCALDHHLGPDSFAHQVVTACSIYRVLTSCRHLDYY